jgi:hypothetical protein
VFVLFYPHEFQAMVMVLKGAAFLKQLSSALFLSTVLKSVEAKFGSRHIYHMTENACLLIPDRSSFWNS